MPYKQLSTWASLIFIVLACTTSLIALTRQGKTSKFWLRATVGLVVVTGVTQIIEKIASHSAEARDALAKAASGQLRAVTSLTEHEEGEKGAKFQVGRSKTFIQRLLPPTSTKKLTVFRDRVVDSGLYVRQREGTALISVVARDSEDHIVAVIDDNGWIINPNKSLDRNYTSTALEVKDERGFVVLQVRLLEDLIQFQGRFFNNNGQEVFMCEAPDGQTAMVGLVGEKNQAPRIRPMFKYPSAQHLGEFLEDNGDPK